MGMGVGDPGAGIPWLQWGDKAVFMVEVMVWHEMSDLSLGE